MWIKCHNGGLKMDLWTCPKFLWVPRYLKLRCPSKSTAQLCSVPLKSITVQFTEEDTVRSLSAGRRSGLMSVSERESDWGRGWKGLRQKASRRCCSTLTRRSQLAGLICSLSPLFYSVLIKWKCYCISVPFAFCFPSLYPFLSPPHCPAHSHSVNCFQRQQVAP